MLDQQQGPLQIGDELKGGRYKIKQFLGQGSSGTVYLADESLLTRQVVIKILSPELADDEITFHSLLYEARAAVKLDHPHIIRVYTLEEELIHGKKYLYLVMEYANDGDLRDAFPKLIKAQKDRFRIMLSIAEGLAYAHENGFLHRDLKPDNIFVKNGIIKIGDLGTAKVIGEKTRDLSTRGIMTPVYSSPEQLQFKALDARSDIYTMGVIFFEILTGKRPYKFFDGHLNNEPPPRVSDIDSTIPEPITEMIAWMMAKRPDDRPSKMDEVIRVLKEFMEGAKITLPIIPESEIPPTARKPKGVVPPAVEEVITPSMPTVRVKESASPRPYWIGVIGAVIALALIWLLLLS